MYFEKKIRSLAKTISWRFWATLTTIALVFLFTRRVNIAMAIGGFEVILKLLLYYVHERAWGRVRIGIIPPKPAVLWFTGLSGSGKSTIAEVLYERLKRMGFKVDRLDGDTIRDIFPKTGFSKEERDHHIKRVGYLASRLEHNGVFVIASFISPYEEVRQFVRGLCQHYVEIYVSTPLEECERRDVKGLYKKARAGEIPCFTGISDPYEVPKNPDIVIDTTNVSVEDACDIIIKSLKGEHYPNTKKFIDAPQTA